MSTLPWFCTVEDPVPASPPGYTVPNATSFTVIAISSLTSNFPEPSPVCAAASVAVTASMYFLLGPGPGFGLVLHGRLIVPLNVAWVASIIVLVSSTP